MTPYRLIAPFQTSHAYPPGQAPCDHHPPQWGPLTFRRYLELGGRWKASVHSTERRRDGWSFNVLELADFPAWISYWHNAKSKTRVLSHRSADPMAGQLVQAFDLYEWG